MNSPELSRGLKRASKDVHLVLFWYAAQRLLRNHTSIQVKSFVLNLQLLVRMEIYLFIVLLASSVLNKKKETQSLHAQFKRPHPLLIDLCPE